MVKERLVWLSKGEGIIGDERWTRTGWFKGLFSAGATLSDLLFEKATLMTVQRMDCRGGKSSSIALYIMFCSLI